jgi:hypothetical protein
MPRPPQCGRSAGRTAARGGEQLGRVYRSGQDRGQAGASGRSESGAVGRSSPARSCAHQGPNSLPHSTTQTRLAAAPARVVSIAARSSWWRGEASMSSTTSRTRPSRPSVAWGGTGPRHTARGGDRLVCPPGVRHGRAPFLPDGRVDAAASDPWSRSRAPPSRFPCSPAEHAGEPAEEAGHAGPDPIHGFAEPD